MTDETKKSWIDWIDWKTLDAIVTVIVWISVVCYIVEISTGSANSRDGVPIFLWIERTIAFLLTVEYGLRIVRRAKTTNWWEYPTSIMGIIDLASILPFWVGFFVPASWLGMVRTLRILRLFKFIRYSRSLQLVALGFYRSWNLLKSLAFGMVIVSLLCMACMHQAEKDAQPEAFDSVFNTAWFTMVTVTTVGYGDMSPVTKAGKLIAMMTFIPSLALFAGIIGVLGSSFVKVIEEEIDPNVDPIQKFKEARQIMRETRKMLKEANRETEI